MTADRSKGARGRRSRYRPWPAGTYSAYCSVPGHKDLGMTASVVASQGGTGVAAGVDASSEMGDMSSCNMSAQQMAEMHQAGVSAFLAGKETTTLGG
jgi:hypothetical protein